MTRARTRGASDEQTRPNDGTIRLSLAALAANGGGPETQPERRCYTKTVKGVIR
jgi:hypothetical protein